LLPEPALEAIAAAARAGHNVLDAVAIDPVTTVASVAGVVLLPVSLIAYNRYSGYAGDLAPLEASTILQARF